MNTIEEKIQLSDKKKNEKSKAVDVKLTVGTKVLWLLNKKEYTKTNTEKPFSRWESLNGGVLMIDDNRVLRKDAFKVLDDNENK